MSEESELKNLTFSQTNYENALLREKEDKELKSPFKKQSTIHASKTANLMRKSRNLTSLKGRGFKKHIRFIKENYRNLLYKPYYDIDYETLLSFEVFCCALKENKKLEHLDMSGLTIHPFMVLKLAMAIEKHPSLRSINLSNTSISNLGVKYMCAMLKSNNNLRTLNLFNNLIIRENLQDFEELLRRNKGLREINFNYCNLDGDCVRVFAEILRAKSSLNSIKLAKEDITIPAARALSDFLASRPKLKELDLSNNQINQEVLAELVKSLHKRILFKKWRFPTIKKLNLTMNRLHSQEAMESLVYLLSRILRLKSLNLTKNFLTSENLKILQKIQLTMTHLKELNLSRNNIANYFPENFFTNILKLDVSHNKIAALSVKTICEHLRKDYKWQVLNLSHNLLESEDMSNILQALVLNSNLQTLSVGYNFIRNDGFKDFTDLSKKLNIKELDVSGNQIDENVLPLLFSNRNETSCLSTIILEKIAINQDSNNENSSQHSFTNLMQISLKPLESLSLLDNTLMTSGILSFLSTASKLKKLSLEAAFTPEKESITILSQFLTSTKTLEDLNLKGLNLGSMTLEIENIFYSNLSENTTLLRLNLSKNKLSKSIDKVLAAVVKLKTLAFLDLSHNSIDNEKGHLLADFLSESRITEFDLSSNLIGCSTFEKIAHVLTQENIPLKVLRISNTLFFADDFVLFGLILRKSNLTTLDISNNQITNYNAIALENSERENLTEVKLQNTKFDNYQYNALIKILQNTERILTLDLRGSIFLHQNMRRLIKIIPQCRLLQFLDISYISFYDQEISDIIISLKEHNNLRHLKLNFLECRERSFKALQKILIRSDSPLRVLDLSETTIKPLFLRILFEHEPSQLALTDILLEDSQIDDECLSLLGDFLSKNRTIERLVISKNQKIQSSKDIMKFFSQAHKLKKLDFSKNILSGPSFSALKDSQIIELNLERCFDDGKDAINLFESLRSNRTIRSLNLNSNKFDVKTAEFIGKLIIDTSSLTSLSLSKVGIGFMGMKTIIECLEKNKSLEFIDLSANIETMSDGANLCKILQDPLTNNLSLTAIDISENFIMNEANLFFTPVLRVRPNLFIVNSHWIGIKKGLAIALLNALEKLYSTTERKRTLDRKFKTLNFSMGQLDDDFCIHFAINMHRYVYLEEIDISDNPNITLIGLKYIFVNLNSTKKLKQVYFKSYNRLNFLNCGISFALTQWGRYSIESSCWKRFLQKIVHTCFSKMQIVPNRFQYNSKFEHIFSSMNMFFPLAFFLINFIVQTGLSVGLPTGFIISCSKGHKWESHWIYGIFVLVTFLIELVFWIFTKRKIEEDILEKDIKREIFINDVLNLLGGAALRLDIYLDVCFITVARACELPKLAIASLVVSCIKYFIKVIMNLRSLAKLIRKIKLKVNDTFTYNIIAKLAFIQDYVLGGDILDRYLPGNAKRIKRLGLWKLSRSIYLSMNILMAGLKLFTEDIPQTVIQIIFIYYNPLEGSQTNWIILVGILKNLISLIASFYSTVSIRPSFLEQSDFDERLQVSRLTNYSSEKSVMRSSTKYGPPPLHNNVKSLDLIRAKKLLDERHKQIFKVETQRISMKHIPTMKDKENASNELISIASEDNLDEKTENIELMTYSNWQKHKNSASKEASQKKKKNTFLRPRSIYEMKD